jgi:hypothetical protein
LCKIFRPSRYSARRRAGKDTFIRRQNNSRKRLGEKAGVRTMTDVVVIQNLKAPADEV